APARDGGGVDLRRDHRNRPDAGSGAATSLPRRRATRGARVVPTVVLLGTLDTKGTEYAFLRDRLLEHGVDVLLVDAGVNDPSVTPDIGREKLAPNVAELAAAGDRGAAVTAMAHGAEGVVAQLHRDGRLDG